MLKKVILIIISVVSIPVFAGSGWTNYGKIIEINHQQNSGAGKDQIFISTDIPSNPSGCSSKGFYFKVTDARTERMFSMLLAAKMAGKEVKLFTTGVCHAWGNAQFDGVVLK